MTSIRVRYYEDAKDVLGELSKVCIVGSHYDKYIDLRILPPHCSHMLQPLDFERLPAAKRALAAETDAVARPIPAASHVRNGRSCMFLARQESFHICSARVKCWKSRRIPRRLQQERRAVHRHDHGLSTSNFQRMGSIYSRTHLMARARLASWSQRVKWTEIRLGPVISARCVTPWIMLSFVKRLRSPAMLDGVRELRSLT
jgi:hypothetical protein